MKFFYLIITTLVLSNCASTNESERLDEYSEIIKLKYDFELESYLNQIEQLVYDKFDVKAKLKNLDSLTKEAIEAIGQSNSRDEVKSIYNKWREDVLEHTGEKTGTMNIERLIKDSFYKSTVKFDVLFQAREHANGLSGYIGAQDIKLDVIGSFVIPESTDIYLGQSYKAKVLMAGYSEQTDQIIEIRVNGTPIPFEGGIGIIDFKPTKRGPQSLELEFIGKLNDKFLTPYDLNKTVEFEVK